MPSNNTSSTPESQVIPKAQETPWYIRYFITLLIGSGLGGGAAAILLPWFLWVHCGMSSGSSDQLRLHLLYVTGGIIAVLTLLQTNWKNQGDRLKIDADIKKNEQDAEKNERDHIRQVHAERRSRYTKAVEQLANEKAAVRLGSIYTLVGLVDEWLADESLQDESDRLKEGQVIVNSLCSYIRSPFTLALKAEMFESDSEPDNYEGDFSKDQAAFREEQDVRRTVFVEMSKRSSAFTRDGIGTVIDTFPGKWSDFEFDFSRAPIFYPLKNLTIEQGNFASTRFYGKADFWGAKFIRNADFRNAKFTKDADFWGAEFTGNADFQYAEFLEDAGFRKAKFTCNISFGGAELTGNTYFGGAEFTGNISFRGAEFTGNAHFGDVYLGNVKFVGDADFGKAKFARNAAFQYAKFTRNADFWEAEFTGDTDFWEAEFTGNANFLGAKFTGNAHFLGAKFTGNADYGNTKFTGNTYFMGAKFTGNADFENAKFTGYVDFNGSYFGQYAPTFAGISGTARFSAQVDPQDYIFTVHEGSKAIKCGTATLLGKSFIIPLGTVLFNPNPRDKNSRTSEPAKPLDESNNGEDDNPE
ncbi:pentapeptide repeat-containing protein [Rothia sp. HMSC062H08]|uniref:pentapeptide repeat-containing protein n=1 Tax=Rothia sp. HMSC062H08 TaxID=1739269 RepID=UPI0008A6521B|nr:pentapeptide repeat-containing protein [Rothia sp. HMSC062H08]